ncbi:MAG TPA: CHAT domain-containing protein [Terracidiphilus sp.]|nr:CHAT domain-containing protein [Terracidiphilus sp.]
MCNEPNPSPSIEGGQPKEDLLRAFDAMVEAASTRSGDSSRGSRLPDCPDPGRWLTLALGEASPVESESLLTHAATCRGCFMLLRASLDSTSADISSEEQRELGQFGSSSPQWRHRLAVELAQTPHRARRAWRPRLFVWAGAVAAMTVILVAGIVSWWRFENAPSRLLAEAYTHSRAFDLRISGAGFAPVVPETHLRGGDAGHESPELLSARAEIERKLEKAPNDPRWLQLEARANLLDERYDSAIDVLDRLLAAGPVSASLLTDDASAYFQRGIATGSENDRATALDLLRRADELAPGDPVVLFNEACVMEDRGQVMNAVETWNRYLQFERDPKWEEEGRRRLETLQQKLKKLQTHASRMDQHLATPQAMRSLASDNATLASFDEELSTTLLPRLLEAAFPLPVDRSRGSPCDERCTAARSLLQSLAASLERNHQDPWLHEFLLSSSPLQNNDFPEAAHAMGEAIDADSRGQYSHAEQWSLKSRDLFRRLRNQAGEDRADLERAYALQRLSQMGGCFQVARGFIDHARKFPWIQAFGLMEYGICDARPGTATDVPQVFESAKHIVDNHSYSLLSMRARNLEGGTAVDTGNSEEAWRVYIATLRQFYAGDYPAFRAYTILSGLADVEESTPRVHLELLLQRELTAVLQLTDSGSLLASQRYDLAIAAIRAGYIPEAQEELRKVRSELAEDRGNKASQAFVSYSEVAMANLFLAHGDLNSASATLNSARDHLIGVDDNVEQREYAAARGQLDLEMGHPDAAEPMLRNSILEEEREAKNTGPENIVIAQQNRNLYATLAGVWLAQGRPPLDILSLWERYRLRILGSPIPPCPNKRLDCLKTRVQHALDQEFGLGHADLLGQISLVDRVLIYRADSGVLSWSQAPVQRSELVASANLLERVVASPVTSQASVDQAALRLGTVLIGQSKPSAIPAGVLMIESDPVLGNLPWPAVETKDGSLGLRFALEEAPSILLERSTRKPLDRDSDRPLVIGASDGAGEGPLLPEALNEARTVASLGAHSNLLLAKKATEPEVAAALPSASLVHFAGHAVQQNGETRLLLASTGSPTDTPYLDKKLLLHNPPRHARLVVFSACSTGKREAGWNHDMGDIVDTLAYLGVPEVVATRWQIDSQSAVSMMDSFYRGLGDGHGVPQALTAARQSLVRNPRYRHPYYWAAYYASGVGNPDVHEVFNGNHD